MRGICRFKLLRIVTFIERSQLEYVIKVKTGQKKKTKVN